MDIKIIQDHINSKDWDALSETNILRGYNYNSTEWKDIHISKQCVFEFFLDKTRYMKAWNLAVRPYQEDVFKRLNMQIEAASFTMSVEDWKLYAQKCIKLLNSFTNSSEFDKRTIGNQMLSFAYKDANYLRIFKDKNLSNDIFEKVKSSSSFLIQSALIEDLTPDEAKEIGYRSLTMDGMLSIRFSVPAQKIMVKFFDEYFQTYTELKSNKKIAAVEMGLILSGLSVDEFETYVKKNYTDMTNKDASTLTTYYKYENKDVEISDELTDVFMSNVHSYMTDVQLNIVSNLSKDQITKHVDDLSLDVLILTDMSLDEIVEIKPKAAETKYDISGKRFFTEEEIINHPNLFDPSVFKRNATAYMSKTTFKLLNKTWKRSQRYPAGVMDFSSIVSSVKYNYLTIKTIKYIKEKTGVTDEAVIEAMQKGFIGKGSAIAKTNPDGINLYYIRKFLKDYT